MASYLNVLLREVIRDFQFGSRSVFVFQMQRVHLVYRAANKNVRLVNLEVFLWIIKMDNLFYYLYVRFG